MGTPNQTNSAPSHPFRSAGIGQAGLGWAIPSCQAGINILHLFPYPEATAWSWMPGCEIPTGMFKMWDLIPLGSGWVGRAPCKDGNEVLIPDFIPDLGLVEAGASCSHLQSHLH